MLPKVNIESRLARSRNKRIDTRSIMNEVQEIFENLDRSRIRIANDIENPSPQGSALNPDLLKPENIYHISDIKKMCVVYRLRFLSSNFFKGTIPEEALSKVRSLEKEHGVQLSDFKIMAPARLLKLENADDPLLFINIAEDYYYLVHKWGNDLHPLRRLLMWPYKCFENLVFTVFLISILLTAIFPMQLLTKEVTPQEYLMLLLFMFKAVGGIVLFYGFARGKNFNSAIWDSRFYNA